MNDLSGLGERAIARSLASHDVVVILEPAERAGILSWLADLFAEPPSTGTVTVLRGEEGERLLAVLAADTAFAPGVAALVAALAEGDDETAATRIGVAFGRLFLGIGGPNTVAPYESVHTSGGRLFQAPTGDMERLLAVHDLKVTGGREPADHLAIEVALLARLIGEGHPDRTGLAARLAGWLPIFRDRVIEHDGTGFYAGAARLLASVVDRERDTTDVTAKK